MGNLILIRRFSYYIFLPLPFLLINKYKIKTINDNNEIILIYVFYIKKENK